MDWLDDGPWPDPAAPDHPRAARDAFLWVTEGVGLPPSTPATAVSDLLARLGDPPDARRGALVALAEALPEPPQGTWVGLPPRLWENLVHRAGASLPPATHVWVGDRQRDGLWHDGAHHETCTEWWGDARRPGACYGDRLWAWGTVLGTALPRCGWRWQGRFVPSPTLLDLADQVTPTPLVHRGPAHLLACLADAMATLASGDDLTHRDAAALWGGYFLPLLAPTLQVETAPPDALAVPPDYALQLAFHLLHPRARVALLLLDRIATWADSGDHAALSTVLGQEIGTVGEAVDRLLEPIARAALARGAAAGWDGGIGFRLLRRVIRTIRDAPEPLPALDEALHGAPDGDAPTGPLADRLRQAFGTALTFADRADAGAATSQLVDLVFLRWTDPGFG